MERVKPGLYISHSKRFIISRQYDKTWLVFIQSKNNPNTYETTSIWFDLLKDAKAFVKKHDTK